MSFDTDLFARIFCFVIVLAPLTTLTATAVIAVFEAPISERMTNRITQASILAGLFAGLGMLLLVLLSGRRGFAITLGDWVFLPEHHFRFSFTFLVDRLSVAFLLLSLVLSGVVAAFARVYLHREPGYRRFYLLFTIFVLGMSVSSIAGTIETLFAGWELVGLSSALLVGFFQERPAPVRNGLRVWAVYRVADAAFLAGALALHHIAAEGDLARMTGGRLWAAGMSQVSAAEAFGIGLLLLVAAAGKSGLIPFSGWLPRAMEGPTPSSAIFYGALSIHLGAFLLLRVDPLIERSRFLCLLVVALGLATALWASIRARVQADIKGALAYASLTQVGLIVAEIGLGLQTLALAHIIGNATVRTLQLLRAPSLLHDYHQIENAIGSPVQHSRRQKVVRKRSMTLYRWGYERGFSDIVLDRLVVHPLLVFSGACEGLEQRWTRWLSGKAARAAEDAPLPGSNLEPWP